MKTRDMTLFTAALAATLVAGSEAAPPIKPETLKAFTFTNTRDTRFGEILVVKKSGVEVYNTTGLNDCPAKVWDAMDPKQLAKELGALEVIKNGPHFWMMDEQTASFGETATFAGLDARWAARLSLSIAKAQTGDTPIPSSCPRRRKRWCIQRANLFTNSSILTATTTSCKLMMSSFRLNRSRRSASG